MTTTKKYFGILGFAFATLLTVNGCNNTASLGNAEPAKTGQTVPIHQPTNQSVNKPINQPITHPNKQNTHKDMIACPPFDPELNMCTMQYDPVCVKEKQPDGTFSYRTAGNACMACGTPSGVEYYAGECQ